MILNSNIWTATIETAKAKSANNAYILRALDRAIIEIIRAMYWSFADGVLTIKSTTSGKLYKVGDDHKCEAHAKYAVCKHQVARRLMQRYLEALQVAEAETKRPPMLAEAGKAVMKGRALSGERYGSIDV